MKVSEIESAIVEKLIDSAFSSGYAISVVSEEDWDIAKSRDKKEITDLLGDLEHARLYFHVCEFAILSKTENKLIQIFNNTEFWVQLVFGNDGYDVITDYLINHHSTGVLKPVEDFIKELEAKADAS